MSAMKPEEKAESRLIDALNSNGFMAFHVRCDKDGFPDIVAFKNNRAALIEVKVAELSDTVASVFEESQPVFTYHLSKSGFNTSMAAIFHKSTNNWSLVQTDNLLPMILENNNIKIRDLPSIRRGVNVLKLPETIRVHIEYPFIKAG